MINPKPRKVRMQRTFRHQIAAEMPGWFQKNLGCHWQETDYDDYDRFRLLSILDTYGYFSESLVDSFSQRSAGSGELGRFVKTKKKCLAPGLVDVGYLA